MVPYLQLVIVLFGCKDMSGHCSAQLQSRLIYGGWMSSLLNTKCNITPSSKLRLPHTCLLVYLTNIDHVTHRVSMVDKNRVLASLYYLTYTSYHVCTHHNLVCPVHDMQRVLYLTYTTSLYFLFFLLFIFFLLLLFFPCLFFCISVYFLFLHMFAFQHQIN